MTPRIELIGLDLDNTALNARKQITPAVREAIAGAIAAGVQVLPATGRMRAGIPAQFLEIPGVRYAVTSNGAKVYDLESGAELHSDCFTIQKTLDLLDACRRYQALVAVYVDGEALSDPFDPADFTGFYSPSIMAYIANSRRQVPDLAALIRELGRPPEKMNLMFRDDAERTEALAELTARGDCAVTSSIPGNLELNTPTANKGAALLRLGERLGIPQSRVMAVGDGLNDLEMLRQVGWGVAMGDSAPELLAVADDVTLSAEEDGVAHAIRKVLAWRQRPPHDGPAEREKP